MASPAQVTAVLEYAEVDPGESIRTTAITKYAEIDPGDGIRTTAIQEYAEINPGDGIILTALLGYIEVGTRVTLPSGSRFLINGSAPPWYAEPDRMNPPVVRYPEPTAKYGGGKPARAIGLPSAMVGREWINQDGLDWWLSLFTSTTDPYVTASVSLYDPLSNGWRSGSGYIWKPEYKPADNIYAEFRVKITGLEFWE